MVLFAFLCSCVSSRNHFFTGGITEVVEHLPSKHAAQSSNPNTAKKNVHTYHKGYIKNIMVIQNLPNKT
jgi:hypothetical protein